MRYNIITYLIGEGFKNILKNKKSTASSLAIMCMVMLVFGAFFIIGENINYIMNNIEDAQAIQVFFEDDVTDEEAKSLGEQINKINGVNKIEFVSKSEAYNIVKTELLQKPELAVGYEDIFPPSYIVTFTDLNLKDEVQKEIKKIDKVDSIESSNETMEKLMNLTKGIRIGTGILLVILVMVSIFIISNTIKLTVYSRRKEISIMKYVGATNNFIRWPFIVEGIIIGILSGAISLTIVGGGYNFIADQIVNSQFMKITNMSLVGFADMFNLIIIIYLLLGIGIGVIGSTISMRKYLKV